MAVDADAVYVVDGSGILRFITTETGFGATQRISYPNSFGSETIAVDDRGIYVIGYNGLLTVFDKASGNNFSIQLDSNYNNSNFNPTMFIVGTRLYTGNLIIDISNLAQPTQVGTLPSGNVRVVGNTAFVGMKVQVDQDTWAGELHILDVTNPATPVVRGVYRTCSSPINSYFFTKVEVIHATPSEVTINTCNGAELLNVANLNQPQRIAKLGKSIQAVDGDLLYSIDGDSLSIRRMRRDLFPTTGVVTPSGGSIANVTNSVQLIFPPNAVTNNTSVIYSGLVTPSTPLGGGIAGLLHFTLTATQMNDTIPVTQFNQSYTMTITYTDAQIAGLDETSLTVMYWNGSTWINMLPCAGCSVDTVNNRITIIADHFTEFAVVGNRLVQENVVFLPLVQK